MHPSHQICKEVAAPVPFHLAAHSLRVQRTSSRPHAAAGLQHGVISSCQVLLSESLSFTLWHSSVTMASRISPAVCRCGHVESRNGSRFKSVCAFAPFHSLSSVTAAQTGPTRPALTDITCTQKVLWVLTTGCSGLCPPVHPIALSAPWGFPNQGSAPLMWGLATVTCPHAWPCHHPAASVGSRDLTTHWDPCRHLAASVGSRNLRKHCESPPFAMPAALPRCLIPAALPPRCHACCHRQTIHQAGSQVPRGEQQGPPIPRGAVGKCLAPAEEMSACILQRRWQPVLC